MDDEVLTGNYRSPDLRRVGFGVFLPRRDDLAPDQEWRRDLAAWAAVLREDAVLTHVTAARLLGWTVPAACWSLPVFVSVGPDTTIPRRPGLLVGRIRRPAGVVPTVVNGLAVDAPGEVLVQCARDLALLDLVPLVESALRSGATSEQLLESCVAPRAGVAALRVAIARADPSSPSPRHTVLRLFCDTIGVGVRSEVTRTDARLRVRDTSTVLRADADACGVLSRGARADSTAGPLTQVTIGLPDLVEQPAETVLRLDALLGRRTDRRHLTRWIRLVPDSTHAPEGRRRLMHRWSGPTSMT